MNQSEDFNKLRKVFIGLIDIALYHFSILFSFYIQFGRNFPIRNYDTYRNGFIYIMAAFLLFNILFGVYVLYNKSLVDFLYITVIIQLIMTVTIMAITFFGRWFAFPRSVLIISFFVSAAVLFIWRIVVFKLYMRISGTKKVAVVGDWDHVQNAVQNFTDSKNERHRVSLAIVDDYYKNLQENMDAFDICYLSSILTKEEKLDIYDLLLQNDKKIFVNTSFENVLLINPNIMNIEDESIIEISDFRIPAEDGVIKRLVDVLFALLLLIMTSPIFLVTALLIKLDSKGPVFYKQVRITLNNQEFNILKFRTMSATAEKSSGPVLATSNDARITRIGKFLRVLRIDELPQMVNVLKGEMSIVGPRPERPFFVDQFKKENRYYPLRHNVRAGITGYAQVYGKYASNFNSKLNFDLIYIKNYSIFFDIKIMFQTIKILFDKVSSKGLDEEENTNKEIPKDITILK